MINIYSFRFVCLILASVSCAMATAQPFCGWRGENRDGIYNEKNLLKSWSPDGPALLWETADAGKGYSSPVIAGDRLYITGLNEDEDREMFSAYTLDGKRLYTVEFGLPWNGSYTHSRTTPTIVDGKAYVISGTGEIVCIAVADGKILWKIDGGKQFDKKQGTWGTSESPLVFDNKIIYSPGGDATAVVALNASTGELIWKSGSLNAISSYVSPLLISYKGKRQIIGMTDYHVYGINPETGEIQWQFDDWANKDVRKNGDRKICANTPLYKDGKIYVSNGYDQGSFLLELGDDLSSVKLVWRNEDLDTHIGGFVLVNGTIYGSSWTNNNQGDWVAVDWNTGETKYKTAWEGKSKGAIISAENMLYCYDERRGTVALVNATDRFDVVSEFRIVKGDGPHWAHPVIKSGVLYIRHGGALMAYKISLS
ncbi:MAG: PQQ-binding-like beta-propeller repeat protein [Prevotellaceae bacterium]|nr:PQQ-binding-like beta-propeller repeat protein [Prevotellaceae bacterium]